jgi:hypothetical protein
VLSAKLLRFSALCGIASGVFIAVPGAIEGFAGKMHATSFIIALSPALAAPLLVALYQCQAHRAGKFSEVAFAANLIGLGFFGGAAFTQDIALVYLSKPVVSHLKHTPAIVALLGSGAIFAVASVLFGVSMLRAGVYPRIPVWAYTVVLPLFAGAAPLPQSPLKSVLHTLTGVTLVWLAVRVWAASSTPAGGEPAFTRMPWQVRTVGSN